MKLPHLSVFVLAVLVLTAGLVATVSPGKPLANELFMVKGIQVDVTADSAAAARDQALAQGQQEAWRRLLNRLTDAQAGFLAADGPEGGIRPLISNLSISQERTSDVRYVADLSVAFNADRVQETFKRLSIPYVGAIARPVVILPVQEVGAIPTLWEETNIWRAAWAQAASEQVLQPVVVPQGDEGDLALVTADQAANHDRQGLAALAARYGTAESVVAVARGGFESSLGVARVDVAVTRIGPNSNQPAFIETVFGEVEESPDALYLRAARTIGRQLSAAWKRENLIAVDEGGSFTLSVPVSGLPDWLAKRAALEAVSTITQRRMLRLTTAEVELKLAYVGEFEQVERALGQSGFSLQEYAPEEPLEKPRASSVTVTPLVSVPLQQTQDPTYRLVPLITE